MGAFVLRRLLAVIPVLLFASIVVFGLVHLAPGDPALILVGGHRTSPETIQQIRAQYGLDLPLPEQYWRWLGGVLRGDLGESYKYKQPIASMLLARLPITIQLAVGALLVATLLALPIGILSAVYKNTWIDYSLSALALIGVSSPVFFTGVLGVLVFAYSLGWLPAFGAGGLKHMILPSLALGLNLVALNARLIRSGLIEALQADYVRTARAKGLSGTVVVLKHALRNALMAVITVLGLQAGFLLVGGVLVEYTFGLGGVGSLLITSVLNNDFPVVQAITLSMVVVFSFINLAVDLVYGLIDPRVRSSL